MPILCTGSTTQDGAVFAYYRTGSAETLAPAVHRFYLRCFLRLEGLRDFLPYGTQEESAWLVSFTVLLVFVVTLGNQRCLIRSA